MGATSKLEARGVAGKAQQPRRVVLEAAVVEDRQPPGGEVVERAVDGDQLTGLRAGESECERVDREVTAAEVVVDPRGLDLRQRSGLRVALGAGAGEVVADAVSGDSSAFRTAISVPSGDADRAAPA